MGVPGLWDAINKVGKSTSIVRLAVVDGFELNRSRRRAYRIGVDASIWFHHATFSKNGENPEARGLFFRLIFLANLPIIPLFVFDGRERPKIKRRSKLGKSGNHPRERQFKHLLDAFGMEWREARGEAEAELAHLNQKGHIDAVMTDDCDAFLFGAHTVIKNISSKLSGNKNNLAKNSNDKADKYHTMVYNAEDIQTDPSASLSRGGLILFALLSGGDYHKGVERVGKKIALGIARCGFGSELLEAYENLRDYKDEFRQFLQQWRMRVNLELKENSQGHLLHRTSLSLPEDFPDLDVLEYYANPVHSGSGRDQGSSSIPLRDQKNLDLAKVAQLCEEYFEWGYRAKILERFRNLMWPCATMHVLRRAALKVDHQNQNINGSLSQTCLPTSQGDTGTPATLVQRYLGISNREDRFDDVFVNRGSAQRPPAVPVIDANPLVCKILRSRRHTSTDGLLEYCIEISPAQLITIANSGIKGTRQAPPAAIGSKEPKTNPLWIPASILSVVHPSLVKRYESKETDKLSKGKGKRKAREQELGTGSASDEEDMPSTSQQSQPRSQPKSMAVDHRDKSSQGKGKRKAREQEYRTGTASDEEEIPSSSQQSQARSQARTRPSSVAMDHHSWNKLPKPGQTVVFDPWFTSDTPISQARAERRCSGFFFTLPNHDHEDNEDLEEQPNPGHEDHDEQNIIPAINDDYDSEADRPVTRFDIMCDQILTKKRKVGKLKKAPQTRVPIPNRAMDERPSKKRKMSCKQQEMAPFRLLDVLDAHGF